MPHGGVCGHCGTEVRPDYTACTGCGATWRHGTDGNFVALLGFAIFFLCYEFYDPHELGHLFMFIGLGIFCLIVAGMINRPMWFR
jgi:hypothetical protein